MEEKEIKKSQKSEGERKIQLEDNLCGESRVEKKENKNDDEARKIQAITSTPTDASPVRGP